MVLTRFPIPLKSITPLELLLFIVFVIYIVLPIQTPAAMVGYVDSPVGYLTMFVITVYLFHYTTPLLGIMYIFVAYQLISRSTKPASSSDEVPYGSSQAKKDVVMAQMNPPATQTLEEEVVAKMAPTTTITDEIPNADSFMPNAPALVGASMF